MAVIASAGLPLPACQRTLGDDDLVGRVDFLYEAERVVIECDGRRHHFGKVDAERDRWRDLELSAAGWLVIRVTWWQLVHQPERFTDAVAARAGPTTGAGAREVTPRTGRIADHFSQNIRSRAGPQERVGVSGR